jgi:hypothetical protein
MNYSIEKLSSASDCNALLALANKEQSDLEFRKLSQNRSRDNYLERSSQISTDKTVILGEVNALATVIQTLPEGEVKDDAISRKTKLEYRLFTLEEQNEHYGVLALLEKEMEINLIEKQLQEVNAFKTAVEARLAELN